MTDQSLGNLMHPDHVPKFKALCTGEVGSAGAVKLLLVHFRHMIIGHVPHTWVGVLRLRFLWLFCRG